ncbi:MAG TPA: GNAT family N-acetyltransferase [Ignavibacteria bacterium]|jgi:GNAT superfamily N-acetyltransferase
MNEFQEIKFSAALPEQVDEICNLVNSVYRGEEAEKGWTNDNNLMEGPRITIEQVAKYINRENNVIILALIENKIIGCVHLKKINNNCDLSMLSVDVNYQNKKIGREIINKSEDYAKNVFRCTEMELNVIGQRKELIDYYLIRGYILTGKEEPCIIKESFIKAKVNDLYIVFMVKKL